MANADIWWDGPDRETAALIAKLGGKSVVQRAVSDVLPGRRVKLCALTQGISGSIVFLASPQRILGDGRRVSEVDGVLKLGPARLLADEMDRYDKWVSHLLAQSSHFPPLDSPPGLAEIAAAAPTEIHALHYRHVGHVTFGNRFRDLNAAGDIDGAYRLVESLLTILRPWQEIAEPIGSESLTAGGVFAFDRDPFGEFDEVCQRLNTALGNDADLIDPDQCDAIRHLWAPDTLSSERQLRSIVHGDLHVENILLNNGDNATLIDFGATGEGHFLRDLTTLEAHLVMRALSPPGDVVGDEQRNFVADVACLYSSDAFADPFQEITRSPMHAAVMRLRRYALCCLMRGDLNYMPQYVVGVLRHAIRVCTRRDENLTEGQRWIAAKIALQLRDALVIEGRRLLIRESSTAKGLGPYSFLGPPPSPPIDPSQLRAPKLGPCTPDTWLTMARLFLQARRVDLLGVAPAQLISAVLKVFDEEETELRPRLRYVTLPAFLGEGAGEALAPNWNAALIGMRNVVRSLPNDRSSIVGSAPAPSGVTTNCLVRVVGQDDLSTIYLLSQVASPGVVDSPYVLAELADEDGHILDVIEKATARAEPIIMREVDCLPMDEVPTEALPDLIPPTAFRLTNYGDTAPRSPSMLPVAVTILRGANRPYGRQVLVKVRSPLWDIDDFGRLSFLSARILADDVARAYGKIIPMPEDDEDAFDALWESVGTPEPFLLTENVFVEAAMRDVYQTTLLDLPPDRFISRGFHVFDREDGQIQLGFAVFTVDLTKNELSEARRACQSMNGTSGGDLLRIMRVDDLLSGKHQVNRIMRDRPEWLLKHCLGRNVD
ncbi:phosphotransferase [Actinoplanes sp. NPDC026623]|uniref:phosphotransferase n=1 Tax=Actinoplanes sp. NPDC026623 TaxID=3155610 RepID=UPI0033CF856B